MRVTPPSLHGPGGEEALALATAPDGDSQAGGGDVSDGDHVREGVAGVPVGGVGGYQHLGGRG